VTPLDLLLLLPLAVGTVKGYRRGLVLEAVSLLAFVLGVVGGLSLLSAAVPVVRSYLGELFGCCRWRRFCWCWWVLCGACT